MKEYRLVAIATVVIAVLLCFLPGTTGNTKDEPMPYKDPSLPIEKRVDDLVSRMTLEEKVSQMGNVAKPIERLGIPEYDWWNEGLHGVARAGVATVFPQAIGLAATWDTDLMHQVADVISTEARAKNNEYIKQGDHGRYKGLTFWSPNINIFRDPRWGRGQETYGEDPYLTSRMGVAFVKGLQGDDPKYLKVVATPKHYAVHSGPEPERHSFNATVYERDLRTTYLPAFRATIVEAKADSLMCAYNRTDNEPMCANKRLLNDILRKEWGFNGFVVSDCGAISDIWRGHKFSKTEGEASSVAVKAGTDLSCGNEYNSLVKAVKDGLISEAEIDTAVKRLMTARFRLGMFDPPAMVPYTKIPITENDSEAHRALSLKAARESVVLLKNQGGALPLSKGIKTIAVIGPNADAPEVLLGNYNGSPSRSVTPLAGITAKVGAGTKVLYAPGMYKTGVAVQAVPTSALSGGTGLKGEYFNNKDMSGEPALVRTDSQVNFDWGAGSPAPQIGVDNFSVRWSGKLMPSESGNYLLSVQGNGAFRLFVDGNKLVEDMRGRRTRTLTKEIALEAGHSYDIRMEYYESANQFAGARLMWSTPNGADVMRNEAVEKAKAADVVVMVMGISPAVEGEEMDVHLEGFRGGDRTDITLPKNEEELIKAVQAVGKPTVVVLLNGSALAVNWAQQNVAAILDAWYPGEEGGTAIADVLFGDYNPGGRLPVTFYKGIEQLPKFEDYGMEGRTYRYFKGEPLYPFGFGLSYTTFRYSGLKFNHEKIAAGERVEVTVDVRNTGKIAGDEVAQLYISDVVASVPVPIRSLAGIARVYLKPGESKTLKFTIDAPAMSVIDNDGKRVIEAGDFLVSAGGGQPGYDALATTTSTVSKRFTVTNGGAVAETVGR